MFLGAEAMLLDVWLEVPPDIRAVDDYAEHTPNDDADEDDTEFAEVEAVDFDVDEGECLEVGVVDAVNERGVDVCKEDGRVLHHDFHRDDELFLGSGGE